MIENIQQLASHIKAFEKEKTKEFKRVFHGRGNFYNNFQDLTIDSIDEVLFITLFKEVNYENELLSMIEDIYNLNIWSTIILQKRYLKENQNKTLYGNLKNDIYTFENNLKYQLNMKDNQNIGFFPDMKNGRKFIQKISKNKNVLNLFSYTCAFGVASLAGGANQVVNVDMSKGALNTGRTNHNINHQETKKVKFMPYNILKSWSRIRKEAPYDIIIIDPPSFQKGSFAATKDYVKIIKKLPELSSSSTIVLSCLNAPELDTKFIKDIFYEYAPSFRYIRRVKNPKEFPSNDEEKSLKSLVFKNY